MSQTDAEAQSQASESESPEEQVLYRANPAMLRAHPVWFSLGVLVILGGVAIAILATQVNEELRLPVAAAGAGLAIIGLIAMGWWWLQTLRTTFTVTASRTQLRRGLLSVDINEVWHQHVRTVQLTQSVWERIFGVGTLSIASAGKASWDLQVSGLPKIYEAKEIIDQYRLAASHESN